MIELKLLEYTPILSTDLQISPQSPLKQNKNVENGTDSSLRMQNRIIFSKSNFYMLDCKSDFTSEFDVWTIMILTCSNQLTLHLPSLIIGKL